MTLPVPDTSAEMLSIYLQARIYARRAGDPDSGLPLTKREARAAVGRVVKRDARITHTQFNAAVAGRALDRATTARIWRALGVEVKS